MKRRPVVANTNRLKDYAVFDLLHLLHRLCGSMHYTSVPYRRMALHIGLPCVMLNTDYTIADNANTIAILRGGLEVLERRGLISVKPLKHDTVLVRVCDKAGGTQ